MSFKAKSPGESAPESRHKAPKAGGAGDADPRRERQAQALRDNLKKRKAQQRERQGGGAAPRDGA